MKYVNREKYRKYRNNNLSNTKEKEIATKEKILNELNEF